MRRTSHFAIRLLAVLAAGRLRIWGRAVALPESREHQAPLVMASNKTVTKMTMRAKSLNSLVEESSIV
jgi:hypothetical protein